MPPKSLLPMPSSSGSHVEWLEARRLMSFVPIITANALTADNSNYGVANTDPNLVNPWGLAVAPNGQIWVSANGAGKITAYNTSGAPQSAVGVIPAAANASAATPTGIVAHAGAGFDITANGKSVPSEFLAATDNGTIVGYNPAANASAAVVGVDHSSSGDIFKGLAIIGSGTGARIYATDFHNGRVEVFNSNFQELTLKAKAFTDPEVPAGYAPFGIQAIKGKLYVSYARQDANAVNDFPGPAQGIIDIYSSAGRLIQRVATGGDLNSPWAMVLAPSNWGIFRNDLLVGNFGDGTIAIFDRHDNFVEQVPQSTGQPLMITGLWGIAAGTGKMKNTLFFASGPNNEADGILGDLIATKPAK